MAVLINSFAHRAIAEEVQGRAGITGTLLNDPPQWAELRRRYAAYWSFFDGSVWDEKIRTQKALSGKKKGEDQYRYPIQVNPVQPACLLHSHALWGEVRMNTDPLMRVVAEARAKNDFQTGIADRANEVLQTIAYENFMRTMQLEAGLVTQVLGGTVFKYSYAPSDPFLTVPIRVENLLPDYFWAVPRPGSQGMRLSMAKVGFLISASDALLFYPNAEGISALRGDEFEYLEEWTESGYSIRLQEKMGGLAGIRGPKTAWIQKPAANPFKLVPFVYIPHIRAGSFWGLTFIEQVMELAREINSRYADFGDAIRAGTHRKLWTSNQRTPIAVKQFGTGENYLDLGTSGPGNDKPELNALDPPDIPEGYMKLADSLMELLRIAMFTPSAGYGELSGTQRSSETLYGLVWPLEAHINGERIQWTTGLSVGADIALRMLAAKEQAGINDTHVGLRMRGDWAPIFPKSRQALTQELVQRKQVGQVSTPTALAQYGDVPESEIEEEAKRIEEEMKAEAELTAKAKAAAQPSTPSK